MMRQNCEESIHIELSGPQDLLPIPITRKGTTNMTWSHFLESVCGLSVDGSYFVGTSTNDERPCSGWVGALYDPIKNFVARFPVKQEKYYIHLHRDSKDFPKAIGDLAGSNGDLSVGSEPGRSTRSTKSRSGEEWSHSFLKEKMVIGGKQVLANRTVKIENGYLPSGIAATVEEPQPGPSSQVTSVDLRLPIKRIPSSTYEYEESDLKIIKVTGGVGEQRIEPQNEITLEEPKLEFIYYEMEEEDENPSEENDQHLGTNEDVPNPTEEEERDVGPSGNVTEDDDIKDVVVRNIARFDENTLRRIKEEFMERRFTSGWARNRRRAPHSFQFLWDLFKE